MTQMNTKNYIFETYDGQHTISVKADNDSYAWVRLQEVSAMRKPPGPKKNSFFLKEIQDSSRKLTLASSTNRGDG